jgi:hypothetical protein
MTIQPREGAFYRRRDGEIVGPCEKSKHAAPVFPWKVGRDTYTNDGRLFASGEASFDLIEEVPDPRQPASPTPEPDTLTRRDWHAAVALAAILPRYNGDAEAAGKDAYRIADAMEAARKEKNDGQ